VLDRKLTPNETAFLASRPRDSVKHPGAFKYSSEFSPAEQSVAFYLAKGVSNKAISEALNVSLPYVKWQVRVILQKLKVPNRTQAALKLSERVS
jgi:DNA-binding NarL/FixJ family response regulator